MSIDFDGDNWANAPTSKLKGIMPTALSISRTTLPDKDGLKTAVYLFQFIKKGVPFMALDRILYKNI